MSEIDVEIIWKNIETIKKSVESIEQQINGERIDPYKRRETILRCIYSRGEVTKDVLVKIAATHGARPQWVGMQIKAGYLVKVAKPEGVRYSVTEKAVSAYQLDKSKEEIIENWKEEQSEE